MKIEVHRDDVSDNLQIGVTIPIRDLSYINDDRLQTTLMRATFATDGSAKLALIIELLHAVRAEMMNIADRRSAGVSYAQRQYEAVSRANQVGSYQQTAGMLSNAAQASFGQPKRSPNEAISPLYGHINKSGDV